MNNGKLTTLLTLVGLSFTLQACTSLPCGTPTECVQKGADLDSGGDPVGAAANYKLACQEEEPEGCWRLGNLYIDGNGVPHDPDRAAILYQRGCDLDSAEACYALGAVEDKAGRDGVALYKKACALGSPEGCFALGHDAFISSEARDLKAAATHLSRAIELGSGPANYTLALMYALGEGVEADDARASALFEAACKGHEHADACDRYGTDLWLGRHRAEDKTLALQAWLTGCALGHDRSCTRWTTAVRGEREARELAQAGFGVASGECEEGDGVSCFKVGLMAYWGIGTKRDHDASVAGYDAACKASNAMGCLYYADHLTRHKDTDNQEGVSRMKGLCVDGFQPACRRIARWTARGHVIEKDIPGAQALLVEYCKQDADLTSCFDQATILSSEDDKLPEALELAGFACARGDATACFWLGGLANSGQKVEKDFTVAERFYGQSCALGDGTGCNNAAWARCYHNGVCDEEAVDLAERGVALRPAGFSYDTLAVVYCAAGNEEGGDKAFADSCKRGMKENCDRTCRKYPNL